MTRAYWISPMGEILDLGADKHINQVIRTPEKFGTTKEEIQRLHAEMGEPVGVEGKAREEIIKKVMENGFIRIRYYPRSGEWSVQTWNFGPREKRSLSKWAESVIETPRADHHSPVKLTIFSKGEVAKPSIQELYFGKMSEAEEKEVEGFEPRFVYSVHDFSTLHFSFTTLVEKCRLTD